MKLPSAHRYFMKRLSKKNTMMLWLIHYSVSDESIKDALSMIRKEKEDLKQEIKLIEPYIR